MREVVASENIRLYFFSLGTRWNKNGVHFARNNNSLYLLSADFKLGENKPSSQLAACRTAFTCAANSLVKRLMNVYILENEDVPLD